MSKVQALSKVLETLQRTKQTRVCWSGEEDMKSIENRELSCTMVGSRLYGRRKVEANAGD
jgi:hypothetical protein